MENKKNKENLKQNEICAKKVHERNWKTLQQLVQATKIKNRETNESMGSDCWSISRRRWSRLKTTCFHVANQLIGDLSEDVFCQPRLAENSIRRFSDVISKRHELRNKAKRFDVYSVEMETIKLRLRY